MITRNTVDPMVRVKVSIEGSTIVSSVNTNQVRQSMSRERNEHLMESEMEGIRKGYIYISALLFQIYKNMQKEIKKKWDSGTGTTCAKSGSGHSVPVPHLLVPVPPGEFGAN